MGVYINIRREIESLVYRGNSRNRRNTDGLLDGDFRLDLSKL